MDLSLLNPQIDNWRRAYGMAAVVLMVVAPGCFSSQEQSYPVTGAVTADGASLPGGTVSFLSESGRLYSSAVSADGSYQVDLPAGEYRVGVQTASPELAGASVREQFSSLQKPAVEIDPKFQSPNSSGLTIAVAASGANVQDIRL